MRSQRRVVDWKHVDVAAVLFAAHQVLDDLCKSSGHSSDMQALLYMGNKIMGYSSKHVLSQHLLQDPDTALSLHRC